MKKIVAVLFLLLCATSLQAKNKPLQAKDKPNPADFNIKVHISSSQYIFQDNDPTLGLGDSLLVCDTVLNGKKVKLAGRDYTLTHGFIFALINPGDYQIRLIEDKSEKDGSIIRQKYELLLPNGETWECLVVGIFE
jgi:hypothetical protein